MAPEATCRKRNMTLPSCQHTFYSNSFSCHSPIAEGRSGTWMRWDWFHLLPYEAGPVVAQDIVSPPWQGLVTVAGHLGALLTVLQTTVSLIIHTEVTLTQKSKSGQGSKTIKVLCNTMRKSLSCDRGGTPPSRILIFSVKYNSFKSQIKLL